jgi:hypothetical protein
MDLEPKWNEYSQGPDRLDARLKSVPEGLRTFRPAPGKWSIHEIVVHLADSESQSYLRFRTAIAEPGNLVIGCDESAWADRLHYPSQDMRDALALIRLIRKMNSALFPLLPSAAWGNPVIHTVRGRITLGDLLDTYVDHIPRHIAQMDRNEAAWNRTR